MTKKPPPPANDFEKGKAQNKADRAAAGTTEEQSRQAARVKAEYQDPLDDLLGPTNP